MCNSKYFIFAVLVCALMVFAACDGDPGDTNPGSTGNNGTASGGGSDSSARGGSSSSAIGLADVTTHDMVAITPGTFLMGGSYTVTLTRGFYMGKYQVTQELYQAVMGSNPSYFSAANGHDPANGEAADKRPVDQISWDETLVFCNALSVLEELTPVYSTAWGAVAANSNANGYRLPTEAEWEYACRAGTTTKYNRGNDWNDDWGWYDGNSGNKTHEAGKKTPKAWDLYDMHGNIWEWVWDRYGSSLSAGTDPTGPASGSNRVVRGGSWGDSAGNLGSANRTYRSPGNDDSALGFRLARNQD